MTAGIVNIVIIKRLKAYKPISLSICKISSNQDQLYPHKFHGNPDNIFPLIKSHRAKDPENNKIEEKL